MTITTEPVAELETKARRYKITSDQAATLRDEDTHNKRFPLPIETDANAKGKEPKLPYVAQQNQTDIDFLFSRARERGYVLVVLEADPKRRRTRRLYFGPSHEGKGIVLRDVIFQLEWQRALIDFRPTLSTAHQVRSVTVQGWNRNTKKKIEVKVDLDDAELNRNRDLYRLLERCDPELVHCPIPDRAGRWSTAMLTRGDDSS